MSYKKFQAYFFVVLLVGSGVLTLVVFRSYLTMLALGGVLAIVSRPLYSKLLGWLKSDIAAAFLTILIVANILVLPAFYFFASLASELRSKVGGVNVLFDPTAFSDAINRLLPSAFRDQFPALLGESQRLMTTVAGTLSTKLVGFFSNVVGIIVGFVVMLIAAYYFLKDGARIKRSLLALSPLGDEYDELVFQRMTSTIGAVITGILILGLVKGILASVSFWIVGIPSPLFWGVMTGLAAFIPVFGSALVTAPAVIYLLFTGHVVSAVILAVLAVVLIGAIDNFLQPKIVESKTSIHPLLVLLSILGGIEFYGFPGFILGPLTLAVTMSFVDIYKREFRNFVKFEH